MEIWKLNDCEWYAGDSLGEVIKHACEITGLPVDEVVTFNSIIPLSDKELDYLEFTDNDGQCRSFAKELAEKQRKKHEFPCLFASSEW